MTPEQRVQLNLLAQSVLENERHWSQVEAVDRAEVGEALAEFVLTVLGEPEQDCPQGCTQCRAHSAAVGEDGEADEEGPL